MDLIASVNTPRDKIQRTITSDDEVWQIQQLTHWHLLSESKRDKKQRQPHCQKRDYLVHGEVKTGPFVLRLRGILEQKVGKNILGGYMGNRHYGQEQKAGVV